MIVMLVLNVREDYMPYFRMNENFMGDIPALDVKNKAFKINYISPLGSFATWRSTKQTETYDMKLLNSCAACRADGGIKT